MTQFPEQIVFEITEDQIAQSDYHDSIKWFITDFVISRYADYDYQLNSFSWRGRDLFVLLTRTHEATLAKDVESELLDYLWEAPAIREVYSNYARIHHTNMRKRYTWESPEETAGYDLGIQLREAVMSNDILRSRMIAVIQEGGAVPRWDHIARELWETVSSRLLPE